MAELSGMFGGGSSGGSAWPPPNSQTFTSSGTFTVPAGVTMLYISGVGGGGGGASGTGSNSRINTASGGGGGGAGGQSLFTPLSCSPGESIPVTIGAKGQKGAAYSFTEGSFHGYNAGNDGGTTSFGNILLSGGKGGGSSSNSSYSAGSGGGTAIDSSTIAATTIPTSNSDTMVTGATGGKGAISSSSPGNDGDSSGFPSPYTYIAPPGNHLIGTHYFYAGGGGASSMFGLGGAGADSAQTSVRDFTGNDGKTATGYGAGGGGGSGGGTDDEGATRLSGKGGDGKAGIIIVYWH